MTDSPPHASRAEIAALAEQVRAARLQLIRLIMGACPGPHRESGPDRPWCSTCGYTADGKQMKFFKEMS